jgi:hypothetical protein
VIIEGVLSIYGAALATILALAQFIHWWSRRMRIAVVARIERQALGLGEHDSCKGTPLQVTRHGDEFWEEALVTVEVRNKGGTPVQIVAVVIDFVEEGKLSTFQIVPEPLPSVLQPGTRVECSIQKEFLDFAPAVVFFGVVDALGRRFAPPLAESIDVIESSWKLPSRIGRYRRSGDTVGPVVSAFPVRDRVQVSSPRPLGRHIRPFSVKAGWRE